MLLVSRGGGGGEEGGAEESTLWKVARIPTRTRPARVREGLHSSDPDRQRDGLVDLD